MPSALVASAMSCEPPRHVIRADWAPVPVLRSLGMKCRGTETATPRYALQCWVAGACCLTAELLRSSMLLEVWETASSMCNIASRGRCKRPRIETLCRTAVGRAGDPRNAIIALTHASNMAAPGSKALLVTYRFHSSIMFSFLSHVPDFSCSPVLNMI